MATENRDWGYRRIQFSTFPSAARLKVGSFFSASCLDVHIPRCSEKRPGGCSLESVGRKFVFVDGEFDDSVMGEGLTLMMTFSRDPKASFRISLPKETSKVLPTTRPYRLRVFGNVSKALDDDGFVDIAAVAVF